MTKPLLWFRFHDAAGDLWSVFLTTPYLTRALRKTKSDGPFVGKAIWSRRVIYVSAAQTVDEIFDTSLHELIHVAVRELKLPVQLDEELVASVASHLWPILRDIPTGWPPLPDDAIGHVKESG